MKKRAHICIEQRLWDEASIYARQVLKSDFTGLVIQLLVNELGKRNLLESFSTPSERIMNEMARRLKVGATIDNTASSSPEEIVAQQRAIHEAEKGAKSRSGHARQATAPVVQKRTASGRR